MKGIPQGKYTKEFRTRRKAMAEIREYIEIFSNRERLQVGLGYLSPGSIHPEILPGITGSMRGLVYVIDIRHHYSVTYLSEHDLYCVKLNYYRSPLMLHQN